MKKTLIITGFILLFCFPVHASITINPVFGFNGFFSGDENIPLWVFLENDGPGFYGRLSIVQKVPAFGERSPVKYQEECTLRNGESKQYYFTITLTGGFEPLRIELIENGSVREQAVLEIPYRQETAPFLLDLTSRRNLPSEVLFGDGTVRTVAPAGGLLPQHWSGYASTAGIALDMREYTSLELNVRQEIIHYVAAGGTLLFIPGPPARLSPALNDPIIDAVFPDGFSTAVLPSAISGAWSFGTGTVHLLAGNAASDFSRFRPGGEAVSAAGYAAHPAADYDSLEHSLLNSAGVRPLFLLPVAADLKVIFSICFGLLCTAFLFSRTAGMRTGRILAFITLLAAAVVSTLGAYFWAGKQLYSDQIFQLRINQITVPDSPRSYIVSDILLLSSQDLLTGVDAPPAAIFRTADTLPEASIANGGTTLSFALQPWRIGHVRAEYPGSFGLKAEVQIDQDGRSIDTSSGYTLSVRNSTGHSFGACEIVNARESLPMPPIPSAGTAIISSNLGTESQSEPVTKQEAENRYRTDPRSDSQRRLEAIVLSRVRSHLRREVGEAGGMFLIGTMDMSGTIKPPLQTLSTMRKSIIEREVTVLIYDLSSALRGEGADESADEKAGETIREPIGAAGVRIEGEN